MTFAAPLGLLSLLGLPALVAMYFLRRRQPPRTVSALFLWRGTDRRAEAGPRLERFNRELSFALECGAVVAVALFLAEPHCGGARAQGQTLFVLDSSLSMSARRAEGNTVAEAALARAKELARAEGGRVTVVLSGAHPRVALGPAAPLADLDTLRFEPTGPAHDLGPALALARELAGPGARVRLLTDTPIEGALASEIEVIALGEPLENTAFVGARRRDQDGHAQVVLRVARFGKALRVPLVVRGPEGKVLHEQALDLSEGGEQEVRLELGAVGPITAELPDDALPADNRVTLLPSPARVVKVAVELPDGFARHAVEKALEAAGQVSFDSPPDLTVVPEDGRPAPPWTIALGARGKVEALLGPFFVDKTNRLLDGVDLSQVTWAVGETPPGAPLVTLGDRVLVTEEAGSSIHLNVDLSRSGLARTPAWPILVANLLDSRRRALEGARPRQVPVGGAMTLTLATGHHWALDGPEGRRDLLAVGSVALSAPEMPGTYDLLRDGTSFDRFEVEPIAPTESDLRDRSSGVRASTAPLGTAVPDAPPRSTWLLALLTALLAADWWLTGPRRAVSWGAA